MDIGVGAWRYAGLSAITRRFTGRWSRISKLPRSLDSILFGLLNITSGMTTTARLFCLRQERWRRRRCPNRC